MLCISDKIDKIQMLKSRETRFKKSVEELNNRLGRAENFLDSELLARDSNMERIKFNNRSTQRSSLPAEVYRDKNTLVEVTVHRNPGNSKVHESRHQTWADSLSDTDVQYKKPTKSSLARVKKSPRKEKTSSQPVKTSTSKEKDRNIQDLMIELRDLLKVSGVDNIHDFVNEFAKKSISKSQTTSKDLDIKIKDLQAHVEKHQLAAEKYKVECNRYKHEYGVLVKQVDISKDSVNSLEAQVADLKKIISRLTKNNGELLDIVKEKIKYEDIIADLEKKTTILNDELLKEKSNSEQLQNRLMLTQSENDNLRSLSADLRAHLRSGLSGLQYSKPTSRPASVPALGDDTKMILGVKNNDIKDDSDNDSAYDDPNTESLRSRPKSSRQNHLSVPQPGAKIATSTSPPTKMTNNPKPDTKIPGVSQLRMSKSPVRNLFPPPDNNLRTQSRSSTLVDAESINDDKSKIIVNSKE